jgi:hypothetical protein
MPQKRGLFARTGQSAGKRLFEANTALAGIKKRLTTHYRQKNVCQSYYLNAGMPLTSVVGYDGT